MTLISEANIKEVQATELWAALEERDDTAVPALNVATDGYPKLLKALEDIAGHGLYYAARAAEQALATERAALLEALK